MKINSILNNTTKTTSGILFKARPKKVVPKYEENEGKIYYPNETLNRHMVSELKKKKREEERQRNATITDIANANYYLSEKEREQLVSSVNAENFSFAKKVAVDVDCNKYFEQYLMPYIMKFANSETEDFLYQFLCETRFEEREKRHFLYNTEYKFHSTSSEDVTKFLVAKEEVFKKIQDSDCTEKEKRILFGMLENLTPENFNFARTIVHNCEDEYDINEILKLTTTKNIGIISLMYNDNILGLWNIKNIVKPDERKTPEENEKDLEAKFKIYSIIRQKIGPSAFKDIYARLFIGNVTSDNFPEALTCLRFDNLNFSEANQALKDWQ